MANVIVTEAEKIGAGVKRLFSREEPEIKALLGAALKAVEPVWKTVLGKVVLQTVTSAAQVAASGGSLASIEEMGKQIGSAAIAAGVAAEGQTVTTLIGLAAQKIVAEATAAGITPPPAAASSS